MDFVKSPVLRVFLGHALVAIREWVHPELAHHLCNYSLIVLDPGTNVVHSSFHPSTTEPPRKPSVGVILVYMHA